jgi:hypothetical protein
LDLWATLNKDELVDIIGLSLGVSLSATFLAALFGLPLGGVLAVYHFWGRRALTILLNGLLGLPPVVVGLALYLLLSRSGPLGWLGLLFTPGGMILARATLTTPIIGALADRAMQRTVAGVWRRPARRRCEPGRCGRSRTIRAAGGRARFDDIGRKLGSAYENLAALHREHRDRGAGCRHVDLVLVHDLEPEGRFDQTPLQAKDR